MEQIYLKDNLGNNKAALESLEYNGDWMNSRQITISFNSPDIVEFKVGDYVLYRGEKFEINNPVSTKKQAKVNTHKTAIVYSNVKLESIVNELSNTKFLNYTFTNESSANIGGTLNSNFNFHCVNVVDLINRIKANMVRAKSQGIVSSDWVFDTSNVGSLGKTDITIDVSNISCLEALRKCYDEFGVGYTIDKASRTIYVGISGESRTFSFGRGNGLRNIEKNLNNDYPIITRLRVVGSEKNLPRHYYYNLGCQWDVQFSYGKGYEYRYSFSEDHYIGELELKFPSSIIPKSNNLKVYFDFSEVNEGVIVGDAEYKGNSTYIFYINAQNDNNDILRDRLKRYLSPYKREGYIMSVPVTIPSIYINKCSSGLKKYSGSRNADLLQLNKLIPTSYDVLEDGVIKTKQTYGNGVEFVLDPYFDSKNIDVYGIREEYVEFSSDDDEKGIEEIYPTIENTNNTILVGSTIEDDGIFSSGETVNGFIVTINDIGFDLNNTQPDGQSNYGTLCMKSGMCGGREFEITKCVAVAGGYKLTLKRVEDSAIDTYFPNKYYQINNGDEFVITNIEMPDAYVEQAGALLAQKARTYLAKYDHPQYNYGITIDNLYIARDYDEEEEDSIYWNIKEGDTIVLNDEDLEIEDEEIVIDKLVIKESSEKIPEISITLRNEKKENTIARITRKTSAAATMASSAISSARRRVTSNQVQDIVNDAVGNASSSLDKSVFETLSVSGDVYFSGNIYADSLPVVGYASGVTTYFMSVDSNGKVYELPHDKFRFKNATLYATYIEVDNDVTIKGDLDVVGNVTYTNFESNNLNVKIEGYIEKLNVGSGAKFGYIAEDDDPQEYDDMFYFYGSPNVAHLESGSWVNYSVIDSSMVSESISEDGDKIPNEGAVYDFVTDYVGNNAVVPLDITALATKNGTIVNNAVNLFKQPLYLVDPDYRCYCSARLLSYGNDTSFLYLEWDVAISGKIKRTYRVQLTGESGGAIPYQTNGTIVSWLKSYKEETITWNAV